MNSFVVLGLGFGDEGKGATVDHIASSLDRSLVIRFNGGAQCAHNVVTPDGKHHTFAQFGSNSFNSNSATLFSRFAYFNPLTFHRERKMLLDLGVERDFYLSDRARVTTPWHIALNRVREISRGGSIHGSTGMGIGETASDTEPLLAKDMQDLHVVVYLADLKVHFRDQCLKILNQTAESDRKKKIEEVMTSFFDINAISFHEAWKNMFTKHFKLVTSNDEKGLLSDDNLIFEGAQGVLLDEDYGFNPHTTWSRTTDENAFALLAEHNITTQPEVIGVLRASHSRHGAGPFPSEVVGVSYKEAHNTTNTWAGAFRFGLFDRVLFDYALRVNGGVDAIAWTHMDTVDKSSEIVTGYYVGEGKQQIAELRKPKYRNLACSFDLTGLLNKVNGTEKVVRLASDMVEQEFKIPSFSFANGASRSNRQFVE